MRWQPDQRDRKTPQSTLNTENRITAPHLIKTTKDKDSTIKKSGYLNQLNGIDNILELGHNLGTARVPCNILHFCCYREIFECDSNISNISSTDILLVCMRIRLIRCQHCPSQLLHARAFRPERILPSV